MSKTTTYSTKPFLERVNINLQKENQVLVKENKKLLAIFNTGIDQFKTLNNNNDVLQKENDGFLKYVKELEYSNSKLKKELIKEQGKVKKFANMIFGRKSEQLIDIKFDKMGLLTAGVVDMPIDNKKEDKENNSSKKEPKKKKGGQPNHKGEGRKIPNNLPVKDTIIVLPEEEEFYGIPSEQWIPYDNLFEESFMITKEVVWTKIRLLRQKYKPPVNTGMNNLPTILTAPTPSKLIKKGKYTMDVWIDVLNEKYQKHVPIERQVFDAQQAGVDLHQSTVFGGLAKIYEIYLEPLHKVLLSELLNANRLHADETRWNMLCDPTKKLWYMWGFKTKKVTVFVLDATRSADVPAKTLLNIDDIYDITEPVEIPKEKKKILSVDRYSAYKMLERLGFFILAFCWAHQRRDFTDAIKKYPKNLEIVNWSKEWLETIAKLYKINNERIKYPQENAIFLEYDTQLRSIIKTMNEKFLSEIEIVNEKIKKLKENEILDESFELKLSLMNSMKNHWDGLTVFVDNPEVPMDNNIMENGMRPIALGRNNYTGSQSELGGHLAASQYSLVQTCKQNNISFKPYLKYYFQKCMDENINNKNNTELISSLLPCNLSKYEISKHGLKLKKY